jgi:hypothetical protein
MSRVSGSRSTRPTAASRRTSTSRKAGRAKWWLDPIREQWSRGFTKADRRRILAIIRDYQGFLLDEWRRYFSQT